MTRLAEYLGKKVSELVADSTRSLSDEEKERHKIYSLLLMSMVAFNWNSNKRGVDDTLKPIPNKNYGNNVLLGGAVPRGQSLKGDYLGHNIAAFAVDRDGYIIDFDFNHNEIFNSSTQHAEARLLSRIFSLNQINDSWNVGELPETASGSSYGQLLRGVTIYTSLESCAQCSGIMTLGNANEVIYLQEDPGQYKIGNIMYRLTESKSPNGKKAQAPRPIPANTFGFTYYTSLSKKFDEYKNATGNSSITSFLCTEAAYMVFLDAETELHQLKQSGLAHKNWTVDLEAGRKSRLTNEGVLTECLGFYKYFTEKGHRGTPH